MSQTNKLPSIMNETNGHYYLSPKPSNGYFYFIAKGTTEFLQSFDTLVLNYGISRKTRDYSEQIRYAMCKIEKLKEALSLYFSSEIIKERGENINYCCESITDEEGDIIDHKISWDEGAVGELAGRRTEEFLAQVVRHENILKNLYGFKGVGVY